MSGAAARSKAAEEQEAAEAAAAEVCQFDPVTDLRTAHDAPVVLFASVPRRAGATPLLAKWLTLIQDSKGLEAAVVVTPRPHVWTHSLGLVQPGLVVSTAPFSVVLSEVVSMQQRRVGASLPPFSLAIVVDDGLLDAKELRAAGVAKNVALAGDLQINLLVATSNPDLLGKAALHMATHVVAGPAVPAQYPRLLTRTLFTMVAKDVQMAALLDRCRRPHEFVVGVYRPDGGGGAGGGLPTSGLQLVRYMRAAPSPPSSPPSYRPHNPTAVATLLEVLKR